jgi:hypothetical protein
MPRKGAQYERTCCRFLSYWYSGGRADDWFWRSSQSGGRATQRAKQGKTTRGHCGDTAATCSEGEPLIRLVTWEIKIGYNTKANLTEVLYRPPVAWESAPKESLIGFLRQAKAAAKRAGTKYWALIHKRDREPALLYMPTSLMSALIPKLDSIEGSIVDVAPERFPTFSVILFDDFLKYADPKQVKKLLRSK